MYVCVRRGHAYSSNDLNVRGEAPVTALFQANMDQVIGILILWSDELSVAF